MRHVFVHVVRSIHDPFSGIKKMLADEGGHELIDLRFTEEEFDTIKRVEYTDRRLFRIFYYLPIYRSLEKKLDGVLADPVSGQTNVYFSDEGVWAAIWARYRRRFKPGQIRAINVQHGFALIKPRRLYRTRRLINGVAQLLTGFPAIGYGSLGAAGPEPFDLYLTYDAPGAGLAVENTGRSAIPVPRLIKHDLIQAYAAIPRVAHGGPTRVLFAMNPKVRGSPIKCDVAETFDHLLDFARALSDSGARLVIRLHPGMDREVETKRFRDHAISAFADLDDAPSLQQSIAQVEVVSSFFSTLLWEAVLLGLVSVQVECGCCEDVEMAFERDILHLDGDFRAQLEDVLARARAPGPGMDWDALERAEWAALRPQLVESTG